MSDLAEIFRVCSQLSKLQLRPLTKVYLTYSKKIWILKSKIFSPKNSTFSKFCAGSNIVDNNYLEVYSVALISVSKPWKFQTNRTKIRKVIRATVSAVFLVFLALGGPSKFFFQIFKIRIHIWVVFDPLKLKLARKSKKQRKSLKWVPYPLKMMR